jgi:Flp pilus assembly protein TadG
MITVLPVLLLLLFGTIEFGLLFREWMILGHSARVAARTAIVYRTPCVAGAVRAEAEGNGELAQTRAGVQGGTVTIDASELCIPGLVTATATTTYQSIVLGAFVPSLNTVPLTAAATMRNES